ncbi:glycosyltransferase [uncultured Robinsoniella sp.]|uniref:glycosyltransferase n=1 Tax=uncultured Robinsoniella sp. TaxID=904190 RepID=UPI00374FAA7D
MDKYKIPNRIAVIEGDKLHGLIRKINNIGSIINPYHKYCGLLPNYQGRKVVRLIKEYTKTGEQPDIVILQWTQMLLLLPLIKECFPNSKVVSIEEDVAFLGFKRKYEYVNNPLKKAFYKCRYQRLKKMELEYLNKTDLILVNNKKDAKLLSESHCSKEKVEQIAIYYDDYSGINRKCSNKDVVFFGAMGRLENHLSAMWFIEKVFPLIDDKEVNFIVLGGGPHKELLQKQNDRIKILGFVKDISPYFEKSLCLAAPLVLGAGIKVKILEALSSGIPVLTNKIGIEGIPAKNGIEYIHCEEPMEYAKAINNLINNRMGADGLTERAKNFMLKEFEPSIKMDNVVNRLLDL